MTEKELLEDIRKLLRRILAEQIRTRRKFEEVAPGDGIRVYEQGVVEVEGSVTVYDPR